MNFQYAQIMLLIPATLFCLVAWKVKPVKLKMAILVILALLAVFNPFRFKQQGGASFERFMTIEREIPSRVVVEQEEFCEKQSSEMKMLKKESMEVRNEEID